MVMILEGLPYFAAPSRMKQWIRKLADMPDSALRTTGFVLMILGLVVVYLGRRTP